MEGVAGERPAVDEDDRLDRSPVLVINLGSVLGGERAHGFGSFSMRGYGGLTAGFAACGGNQGQGGDTRAGEKDLSAGRWRFAFGFMWVFAAHCTLILVSFRA